MNKLLLDGYETLLQGILISIALAFVTSIVRVSIYGWHGIRDYFASLAVGCFISVCAGWLLSLHELPMPVSAVIIGLAGITGKDALTFLLNRKSLASLGMAVRQRLRWEILHRGAPDNRNSKAGDWTE